MEVIGRIRAGHYNDQDVRILADIAHRLVLTIDFITMDEEEFDRRVSAIIDIIERRAQLLAQDEDFISIVVPPKHSQN